MTVRIELDQAGLIELRKEIGESACAEIGEDIASRCGEGYESIVVSDPLNFVSLAVVRTTTLDAIKDNDENNTLVNELHG